MHFLRELSKSSIWIDFEPIFDRLKVASQIAGFDKAFRGKSKKLLFVEAIRISLGQPIHNMEKKIEAEGNKILPLRISVAVIVSCVLTVSKKLRRSFPSTMLIADSRLKIIKLNYINFLEVISRPLKDRCKEQFRRASRLDS